MVGGARGELARRRADARLQRRAGRRRSRSCACSPERWPALLGGITLAAVGGVRLRAGQQGVPLAQPDQPAGAPAGTVRLLERARADRGDGRDLLHVAGRPPARTRAAERAGLPRLRAAAADAAARLLARRAGGARRRRRAVAVRRAAAPARRLGAAGRRRRRRGGGGLGLLPARAQRRKRRARRARGRRSRARRDHARDGRSRSRSWGWRSPSSPPARRPARRARRRAGHRPVGARGAGRARADRRRAGAQPPRPDRQRLARGQLADQPERQAAPRTRPGGSPRWPACGRATGRRRCSLRRAPRPRSGRGRLRDRAPALPQGDARGDARARLRGADARRPRDRRAARRARAAGRAGSFEARRADAAAEPAAAAVHARAGRPAEHALRRGRVRRALADRLDLVRARQRVRGAAVRRLARRARASSSRRRATGPREGTCASGRARWRRSARGPRWRLPEGASSTRASPGRGRGRGALLAAWAQWQPQRSEDARAAGAHARRSRPPARRRWTPRTRRSRATRCPPKRCFALADVQAIAGLLRAARDDPAEGGAHAAVEPADVARTRRASTCANTRVPR